MSCRSVWIHTCSILWCYVFLKSGLHLDVSFTWRNHITPVPMGSYKPGLQLYLNYKHIQNFITHESVYPQHGNAIKWNFPQNFPWFYKCLKNRYLCKYEDLTFFTKCTSLRVDQTVKPFHHLHTKENLFLWSSKSTQATRKANFESIPRSIDWMFVKHAKYCENQGIIFMKSVFIWQSISKTLGIIWDVVHLDQELEPCKSVKVFNCTVC